MSVLQNLEGKKLREAKVLQAKVLAEEKAAEERRRDEEAEKPKYAYMLGDMFSQRGSYIEGMIYSSRVAGPSSPILVKLKGELAARKIQLSNRREPNRRRSRAASISDTTKNAAISDDVAEDFLRAVVNGTKVTELHTALLSSDFLKDLVSNSAFQRHMELTAEIICNILICL